jgi:NADH-quinone oxidoreductase subunit L/multicomponent Na+:H+ antiporter subunit D
MTPSWLPALAVVLPFAAVGPILASGDRPRFREAWTALAALGTLALTAALADARLGGAVLVSSFGPLVEGVPFAFRADALGAFFALLVGMLWPVASLYAVGYMRGLDEHGQTGFFAAFAASIGATVGVALAANLLTLFVFYELLTLATYPLVTHHADAASRRAGRSYLAYTLTGGIAILAGTLLVYDAAGSLAFVPGGLSGVAADALRGRVALALLLVGFAVKTAVMPLHAWLPEAMVAPTPVSGLLHAVAVVKSGVFGLARTLLFVFGADAVGGLGLALPLQLAAAATMLLAGVLALRQDALKRALAYSTVSQLSYVALGLATLTPGAVFGALFHVVAHAFMKITLFLCAGALYVETGVTSIRKLGGIARRTPALSLAFAVGAAGLAGFPGVAGFVSKWYLVLGTLASERPAFAAAFLLAGVLKLLLFWPILLRALLGDDAVAGFPPALADDGGRAAVGDGGTGPTGGDGEPGDAGAVDRWERRSPLTEARWTLLVPVLLVAAGALVLGIVPSATPFWRLLELTVAEVLAGG